MISILSSAGLALSTFFKGRTLTLILALLAVIGIIGGAILHTQKIRLETELNIANSTITSQNKKILDLTNQLLLHEKAVQQAEANYKVTKNLLEQERAEFQRTKKGLEKQVKRWDNPDFRNKSCSDTMSILRDSAKGGNYATY